MKLKIAILIMPLALGLGGCGDSKEAPEPVKPAAQEPAPKADPPAKVDVHITTDHQDEPEAKKDPEPNRNGIGITIEAGADLEVK